MIFKLMNRYLFILCAGLLIAVSSCKKNNSSKPNTNTNSTLPVVTTYNTTWSGSSYSVTVGGTVVSEGGAPVTSSGICWDTVPHPSLANHVIPISSGTGDFSSTLDNLDYGT